jgi:hypothetical protein
MRNELYRSSEVAQDSFFVASLAWALKWNFSSIANKQATGEERQVAVSGQRILALLIQNEPHPRCPKD